MARAVTQRLRVRPVPGQPFWVLAVRNPVHHTHYLVFLPDPPSGEARFCSCEDFARRGMGTCKHVEAATAWIESHPDVSRPASRRRGVASIWRAIDAARKESDSSVGLDPVRLRKPGQVLFENRPGAGGRGTEKNAGGKGSAGPARRSGA